jgi:hypothetical protein
MISKLNLFLFIAIHVILASCNYEQPSPSLANGPVGQITVVCDNNLWTESLQEGLDSTLCAFLSPYIPDVIEFTLLQRSVQKFNAGNKQVRNVLYIVFDSAHGNNPAKITVNGEQYASNQTFVKVTCGTMEQLNTAIATRFKTEIYPLFAYDDWHRLYVANHSVDHKELQKNINTAFGINLDFPMGSTLVSYNDNFYRIEFQTESKGMETGGSRGITSYEQSGIMIYQYDAVGDSFLEMKSLMSSRDTMLRYNVPHEIDGVYMATQYSKRVAPEMYDFSNIDNTIKGKEIRGMYKFIDEGNQPYTGGAFWEFHFLHPTRKKVICVSGYLDAPSTVSWVFQLRRIQSVLKSVVLKK